MMHLTADVFLFHYRSFLATKFREDVKAIMCREVTRSILHYLNRHLDMAGVIHFDDLMMDLTLLGDVVYDNNFLKFSYNGKFVGDNEELKVWKLYSIFNVYLFFKYGNFYVGHVNLIILIWQSNLFKVINFHNKSKLINYAMS